MTRGIRRDEEPLLIRNYYVLPISVLHKYKFIFNYLIQPIANRSQYKTIDDFDPQPMKTIDNYSTLPSKVPIHRLIDSECTLILQWSTPTASQGIGRSAQVPSSPSPPPPFPFHHVLFLSHCDTLSLTNFGMRNAITIDI